jgi:hypothetical protein
MSKLLTGAVVAGAITLGAAAAHAETCIWLGVWACGDQGAWYTHTYTPPAGPNMVLRPIEHTAVPAPRPN